MSLLLGFSRFTADCDDYLDAETAPPLVRRDL